MSRRGRFAADRQLSTRMVLVVFLLGLLYVVAIAALVAYGVNVVLVLLVAGGFLAVQYFASESMALRALGAREVSPAEEPALHGVIDRLCALSDTPKPRVAVARSDIPNAFAAGRSPDRAVVCVTTGLARRLDPDELEGVLAHEMAHVAHRDVAVMTVASFLGVLAGIVARNAFRVMFFARGGRRDGRTIPVFLAVILVSVVVYAVSFLLLRALSRYRELSADRAAAQLTGRPSALASALTKVSGEMVKVPTEDLREAEPFNAFFFAPALASGFSFSSLFSTHPPLERRLAQLARMSGEL
jgi:heat shock protein HtpX